MILPKLTVKKWVTSYFVFWYPPCVATWLYWWGILGSDCIHQKVSPEHDNVWPLCIPSSDWHHRWLTCWNLLSSVRQLKTSNTLKLGMRVIVWCKVYQCKWCWDRKQASISHYSLTSSSNPPESTCIPRLLLAQLYLILSDQHANTAITPLASKYVCNSLGIVYQNNPLVVNDLL